MDLISKLFGDTLWIYTSILGALLGAAFLAWFRNTNAALYLMSKFDALLDSLVVRFGWDFLQDDPEAWRKRYPKVTKKIDDLEARIVELEKNSHPCKELHEFDVWPELDARIKTLEKKRGK